jgi:hypothetical protein
LIDRTTRGAENPERLRSANHTTKHSGGLDWDLNTHHSTHRSDWDIDTINSNNCKGSVQSDWDIDPGLHNSNPPSTRDTTHKPSLLLRSRRFYFLLFFFFSTTKEKTEKGKQNKEKGFSQTQITPKQRHEARTPSSTSGRRRPKEMLNVAFRKGMTLDTPTTSSPEGMGFHQHRRKATRATSYASMVSLVRRPLTVASNATIASLAHVQGGHRWPRHHDATSTSPQPSGHPPCRTRSSSGRTAASAGTPTSRVQGRQVQWTSAQNRRSRGRVRQPGSRTPPWLPSQPVFAASRPREPRPGHCGRAPSCACHAHSQGRVLPAAAAEPGRAARVLRFHTARSRTPRLDTRRRQDHRRCATSWQAHRAPTGADPTAQDTDAARARADPARARANRPPEPRMPLLWLPPMRALGGGEERKKRVVEPRRRLPRDRAGLRRRQGGSRRWRGWRRGGGGKSSARAAPGSDAGRGSLT